MNRLHLRTRLALALILASGAVRAADAPVLPLDTGTFVVASYPRCEEAPLAGVVAFDGRSLVGPHDSDCHTDILERDGSSFRIRRGCRADGSGKPAIPADFVETVRVESRTRMVLTGLDGEAREYALCPGFH